MAWKKSLEHHLSRKWYDMNVSSPGLRTSPWLSCTPKSLAWESCEVATLQHLPGKLRKEPQRFPKNSGNFRHPQIHASYHFPEWKFVGAAKGAPNLGTKQTAIRVRSICCLDLLGTQRIQSYGRLMLTWLGYIDGKCCHILHTYGSVMGNIMWPSGFPDLSDKLHSK